MAEAASPEIECRSASFIISDGEGGGALCIQAPWLMKGSFRGRLGFGMRTFQQLNLVIWVIKLLID
ncbi:MAG: hypothetical protein CBC35_01900 [Planctomycetes bacterium TMED75]|nr:hypothetical protein [Planctomycetaceae bacterium]OUU96070.1 MAG: hypothetical protein CBC35_01900 [Planctomycetes bacterium TMED75]